MRDEGGEGKLVGACNLTVQIGCPLFTLSWYFIHSLHEYFISYTGSQFLALSMWVYSTYQTSSSSSLFSSVFCSR